MTMKSMDRNKIFLPTIPTKSLFMGLLCLLTVFFISCSEGASEKAQLNPEVPATVASTEVSTPEETSSVEVEPQVKTLRIGVGQHLIETEALITDPNFQRLIWSGLLRTGPDGKLHPGMVAFVPELGNEGISLDRKTYTFRLKEGLVWTDGTPIEATEVLELMLEDDGAIDSSIRSDFIKRLDIGRSRSLDAKTLIIALEEPFPEFLTFVTLPSIFSARNFQASSFAAAPTTGPYTISEWTKDKVVLIANEAWQDEIGNIRSHQIRRIEFIPFRRFSDAYEVFLAGGIDILPTNDLQRIETKIDSDDSVSVRNDPSSVYSIFINHSDEIFDDVATRRSLAMNLSREDLLVDLESVAALTVQPAYSWIPRHVWGTSIDNFISLASTDLLATDSWYVGGGIDGNSIELLYSSDDPLQTAVAPSLKNHWEKHLPVEVILRAERSEEHYADIVSGAYQLALVEWSEASSDPTQWLVDFQTSAADNFIRFSDPQFDELLESGLNARHQQDWHANILRANDVLMEQIGLIPIFSGSEKVLVRQENIPVVLSMMSQWTWDSLLIKN
jgi:oligopeptide transport system substrate-binding protein